MMPYAMNLPDISLNCGMIINKRMLKWQLLFRTRLRLLTVRCRPILRLCGVLLKWNLPVCEIRSAACKPSRIPCWKSFTLWKRNYKKQFRKILPISVNFQRNWKQNTMLLSMPIQHFGKICWKKLLNLLMITKRQMRHWLPIIRPNFLHYKLCCNRQIPIYQPISTVCKPPIKIPIYNWKKIWSCNSPIFAVN